MTIAIPTTEPTRLRAGDTWQWRREDLSSDYPASAWTLTYRFKNATAGFEITATADGVNFAITVAAATTASYTAGDYVWQGQVVNGSGEKHTVGEGAFTLLPNLFSGTATAALDTRSTAAKIVDAIDAMLAGRATLDQQEYEISVGGSMRRLRYCTRTEILSVRSYYAAIVAREDAKQALADGRADKRRMYVRFASRV